MKNILLKVVAQDDEVTKVPSRKAEGGEVEKCMIRLKEPGGTYSDEYLATMFGKLATCRFHEGELVVASLSFRTHTSDAGVAYQDVVAVDMVKVKSEK